jgi:hypothetical protein
VLVWAMSETARRSAIDMIAACMQHQPRDNSPIELEGTGNRGSETARPTSVNSSLERPSDTGFALAEPPTIALTCGRREGDYVCGFAMGHEGPCLYIALPPVDHTGDW